MQKLNARLRVGCCNDGDLGAVSLSNSRLKEKVNFGSVSILLNYKSGASILATWRLDMTLWTWYFRSVFKTSQNCLVSCHLTENTWRDPTVLWDRVVFCFLEIQQGVGKSFSHNTVRVLVSFFCVPFLLSQARNSTAIFAFLFFCSSLWPSSIIPFLNIFLRFTLPHLFPRRLYHSLA